MRLGENVLQEYGYKQAAILRQLIYENVHSILLKINYNLIQKRKRKKNIVVQLHHSKLITIILH